ncbi:MAG: tRNA (guanosine(37)-N1)-methyltransferase TrmD [Clostridia bacterium]|nr:tRNA (guanosine(37)-N1)-methyltransferase TrmD [Clostridia bacterium]MBR4955251.1 tRNA (guanosine(37)-N1)-methyltransferase TrmD [Clostridia bacterium]MBR5903763.1 tRNA (guanosine(37)-N1)-methyltransferase TrmD [Clostridia bacterium]
MRIDILTLFPEAVDAFLGESMIGRGRKDGLLDIRCHNIRDYCTDRYRRTDDYPYGGGQGMIMLCEPLARCLEDIKGGEEVHTLLMSPRGKTFTQSKAVELLERQRFAIVCGHYEGIDQRFIDTCIDEEISLGDFVLTGGEIAAITVADAVGRMVPGVLAENASFEDESHFAGVLEYPQYTRPEVWRDIRVPEVLMSGHHENIRKWRRKQSLEITRALRPDMFEKLELTKEDKKLLEV